MLTIARADASAIPFVMATERIAGFDQNGAGRGLTDESEPGAVHSSRRQIS
jgi:hypothetical protein